MNAISQTPSQAVAAPTPASVTRTETLLFALTSFLSAFLLFQVQLIVSKNMLPWFGGSAAVWTTSMLVFQLLLLTGYLYSHLVSVKLHASTQTRLHLALLAISFIFVAVQSIVWPSAITPGTTWKPSGNMGPSASVAIVILASAGLPFFVLSATSPLLQRWFGHLGGKGKTYRLYAVSNLGSLLGLLTFPFVFEPALRLQSQGRIWSLLFCAFACACGVCAWKLLQTANQQQPTDDPAQEARVAVRGSMFALWFLLAACASALLLSITNLLCQEVITVPLVWVVPLALYLITFILSFDHPRWYQRAVFHPLFAVALFVTCIAMAYEQTSALVLALPFLLFAACMVCHGELARLKPDVKRLTWFYLAVSAGGAAGGVFVGIIAPHIFSSFFEFQLSLCLMIVLLLVVLARDRNSWIFRLEWWFPATTVVLTLVTAFAMTRWIPLLGSELERLRFYPLALLLGVVSVLGAVILRREFAGDRRGFRFAHIPVAALAILALVSVYVSSKPHPAQVASVRSFFGVVQLRRVPGITQMLHGLTMHGAQLDPPRDRIPIMYYGPNSGIGAVLQNRPQRFSGTNLRVGVVGLGAGALAAYGQPGDSISFYELNPDVIRLAASDQAVFTYIRNSAASVSVKPGDARLVLERELAEGHSQNFDVLALDAFNGDAIPVHLLTKEAFDTYWQHLNPETGVIAIHITSRHVNLVPVLIGAANHLKVPFLITFSPGLATTTDSVWFLMARNPEMLENEALKPITVRYAYKVGPRLWTDDYSDIVRLLY